MYSFFDTLILPKVLCLLFRFGEYWILLGRRFINVVMHVPSFNSQQPVVCGHSRWGRSVLPGASWLSSCTITTEPTLCIPWSAPGRMCYCRVLLPLWGGLFCRGVIFKYKYLVVLIIYSILKIILKERQERKQQRLQENAVNPASTSDDVQDVESSGDDLALEQGEPLDAKFCWSLLKESLSEGSCV